MVDDVPVKFCVKLTYISDVCIEGGCNETVFCVQPQSTLEQNKKIHMYMYVIALQCKQQIDLCSMSHVLIRDA